MDGKIVGASGYTTFGEWHCNAGDTPGHKATMGIMAHEFGHDMNWPDLYDTDQTGEGVGEWSLMGSGSWGESTAPGHVPGDSPTHPDAFSKYYQGWITPTVVTVATNDIAVTPSGAVMLGPNPGGPNWLFNETEGDGEYFLLENRTQQGYDASTPGCGVVIYRIDETVTPSNAANADEDDPLVKVMQADGLEDLENGTRPRRRGRLVAGLHQQPRLQQHDDAELEVPRRYAVQPGAARGRERPGRCGHDARGCHHLGVASPPVVRPSNDMFASAVTITGATRPTIRRTPSTPRSSPASPSRPVPAGPRSGTAGSPRSPAT